MIRLIVSDIDGTLVPEGVSYINPEYLDVILDICKKEKIDGAFSLIDPELSLLAKEKEKFLAVGTMPVISPYELVESTLQRALLQLQKEQKQQQVLVYGNYVSKHEKELLDVILREYLSGRQKYVDTVIQYLKHYPSM